ncbi:MAG: hypothetical protein ACLUVC_04250, partial [Longibaculum sp.]
KQVNKEENIRKKMTNSHQQKYCPYDFKIKAGSNCPAIHLKFLEKTPRLFKAPSFCESLFFFC